jgi:hypothetical protein
VRSRAFILIEVNTLLVYDKVNMVGRYRSEEDIASVFSVQPPPQELSPCTAGKREKPVRELNREKFPRSK